ncbi:ABC transporter ATP-binding protein [Reinekea sp.]|jgi:ABC-2 type transport system ATP-binding protein|uniref:ABC transporter ATP-binding protein n=1 Tax=Reinekea sp. TaxID=1970455 RepID=UPI002A819B36|nr:ABC transporter ATP-binding protein [Reinekea sp.]
MADVIAVRALVKKYGPLTAVDGINFNIAEGCCFGLLGPNGAGKTTTIEMLEGIIKPTSGHISLFGQTATKALYRRVGIQFQHTALPDYLSVAEILRLFASFYEQPTAIADLIALCSLGEFIGQDARKLSGGQRQRMLLALALINDPDLLFLDEPTTGLDPQARRNFWDLIGSIKAQGRTIVLTTHYMDEAQILCDEIAILDQGEIVARGAPTDLLAEHFRGVLVQIPSENLAGKRLDMAFVARPDWIEIRTEQVDSTLQQLMAQGIPLAGMQVKSANLDDLFLKLTGHALRG